MIAFFIIAGLVGSLVVPAIEPLNAIRSPDSPTTATDQELAEYYDWLNTNVGSALDDSSNTARAQFLGIQFRRFRQRPHNRASWPGATDPLSSYPSAILNGSQRRGAETRLCGRARRACDPGLAVERPRRKRR